MNKNILKSALLSVGALAVASIGLASCDKGTRPGETNVERSEIIDEGELVGDGDDVNRYSDTTNLEKYYDHADHDNHDDNKNKVIGDGAYDGKGDGIQRDEVKN
jgi:hypothetical protein